jgi:hypothetical protein
MQLTKEIFEQIKPGEMFRIVITRIQRMHEPMKETLKFVCVKGGLGIDWAIYVQRPDWSDGDIADTGDKVQSEDIIRSICPCDDEIYGLYRH